MTLRTLILRILVTLPLPFLIAGCALTSNNPAIAALGLSLHGNVHGGQQPINGAHVYLLAADSSAYGNPSVSLLTSGSTGLSDSIGAYVATAADGSWDITGDYTCTPNTQVYLYAAGGDPGAGVNSAASLMAVLGSCPGSGTFASSVPYVTINEVSTVAAAYAMSGYAVDSLHVASSGTPLALKGIANAFANASNLADLPSGNVLAATPNGNGTVPLQQVNLLADIIASCVNSVGPGSATCSLLLGDATSDGTTGGTAPTDTASAMINIAHNPGANLSDLFNLPATNAPYLPTPSVQPNDLTISLQFTGAGINQPSSVAFDASGNAWVTNAGNNTITAVSSLGVSYGASPFSGNGVSSPTQVVLDASNNVWVANSGGASLSEFDNSGNALGASPFTGGGISFPDSLAFDASGDLWTTSPVSNTVTLVGSAGWSAPSAITQDGLTYPTAVSVDQSGNAWIVNQGANSLTILSNTGTPLANSPVTGNGMASPAAVSIDAAGNAWIANYGGDSLTVIAQNGSPLSGSPFSGGGLSSPIGTAFDGAGNVWVANSAGNGVTELNSAGTPAVGSPFVATSMSSASFIAVDGAGSVWLANPANNSLTEIIGSAIPTVTPIAVALATNSIGARP